MVALEEVYAQRMALVRPSRADLDALGQRYIESLVDDARETSPRPGRGRRRSRRVGRMLPAILILTRHLGLPDEVVAAVDVYFDDDGEYADFDAGSPLAYAGGKRVAIERWLPETSARSRWSAMG